ncbi:hypothetical protein TSAR_012090, partial [Trichomalopsis sarcophagae]
MSDKDTTKRGVLEKIFVDVPLYICRFHTMQIFRRRTLNLKNKTECLEILQALVYSESAENYDYYYNKLCCAASGTSFLSNKGPRNTPMGIVVSINFAAFL